MNVAMNVVNDGHTLIGNVTQGLIIAGLLGWSLFFMLRRVAPNLVRNQQYQLANTLSRHGWPKLARWLEPTLSVGGGCGSGCNTCGSCASNPNQTPEPSVQQPVQWKTPTPSKSSGCH
jgi:hypothetical protein